MKFALKRLWACFLPAVVSLSWASAAAAQITVAVFDRPTAVTNALNTDPDIVATPISNAQIEAGDLVNYDVLLGRFINGNHSTLARQAILNFVASGGGYVGEYWGAGFALTDSVAPFRGIVAPTPLLGLFNGAASGGFLVGTNTPITVTKSHPVTQGLPSPFAVVGATDFFVQPRLPVDPRLSVLATYPESGDNGPAGAAPAIVAGSTGTANAALLFFDAGDVFGTAPLVIAQLFINAVKFAATPVNDIPVGDAGPDQTVNEGDLVNLDGTGSFDLNGDPITYEWTQTGGPAVTLDDDTSAMPSFVAPYVATNTTITFRLDVDDGFGPGTPDFVDIGILQVNNPPIADAGDDGTVKEGAATMLDGTNSDLLPGLSSFRG